MTSVGRVLAGVPGIVLFVCLFLPAVRTCGTVKYPYDYPMLCMPYVLGLLVALALLPIALRSLAILLRIVVYPSAVTLGIAGCAALIKHAAVAVYFVVIAAGTLAITGFRRCDARGTARAVVGSGFLCLGWFAPFLVDTQETLFGVYLSAGASLGMLVGGVVWWRALGDEHVVSLPTARVVRSS